MKIAVIDTETTGFVLPSVSDLDKQPRIIELGVAIIELSEGNFVRIGEYNWIINPGNLPLPDVITKITGIKTEDLQDKLSFKDQLPEILKVLKGCTHMIAHNAPFDTALLRFDLERAGVADYVWPENIICSVQEYVPVYGRRMNLKDLYEAIVGNKLQQTHRAIDDVMALCDILFKDDFFNRL